jgi:thioredoxin 1
MFEDELTKVGRTKKAMLSKKVTAVFATWRSCGPCAIPAKILDELQQTNKLKSVWSLEIDDTDVVNDQFMSTHKVEVIPTLLLFKDGKEVSRVIGVEGNSEEGCRDAYLSAIKKAKVA